MILTTCHLCNYNIEAARPWYLNKVRSFISILLKLELGIYAELAVSVLSPHEDFRIFVVGRLLHAHILLNSLLSRLFNFMCHLHIKPLI